MWLISLPAGKSSLENLELSLKISSIALISEHLSKIITVLPSSVFWIMIFLFFDKCWRALNSKCVRFSGGSRYKLFDGTKFILVFPTFQLIQKSLSRTRWQMKSLHSVLKIFASGT